MMAFKGKQRDSKQYISTWTCFTHLEPDSSSTGPTVGKLSLTKCSDEQKGLFPYCRYYTIAIPKYKARHADNILFLPRRLFFISSNPAAPGLQRTCLRLSLGIFSLMLPGVWACVLPKAWCFISNLFVLASLELSEVFGVEVSWGPKLQDRGPPWTRN